MPESCCAKPVGRIIKVGQFEAGLVGLDEIFQRVLVSGLNDDCRLQEGLVALARQHGNYIAPAVEALYKEALIREYKLFCRNRATAKNRSIQQ